MGSFFSSTASTCGEFSTRCTKTVTHPIINKMVFMPPQFPPKIYSTNFLNDEDKLFQAMQIQFIRDDKTNKRVPYKLYTPIGTDTNNYIVFAHGNGSDIVTMTNYCSNLAYVAKANVLSFEYPGYLNSKESPSENGCYKAIDMVMNHLINQRRISPKNIYLVGQSLGTGVVINYAATHKWNTAIMLISPYKTIASVVINDEHSCSSIKTTVDMFENIKKISKITAPIKIIHGTCDELITIDHAQALYKKTNNKLDPVWIQDCGHNDILSRIDEDIWSSFINQN